MLNDIELKAELTRLEPFERRVPWPYLDVKGLVTTGVGFLLADVDAMVALPWHHLSDGSPATPDEMKTEYFRVQGMRAGLGANAYRGTLRLFQGDIDTEGFRRLRLAMDDLQDIFPGYDAFPAGVQQALLDLRWNCGGAAHPPGLRSWTHLLAACNSVPPDWKAAAGQCRTANPDNNPQRAHRNDWRSSCFVDAAAATPEPAG
jgi:hypothetical protein